MTENEERQDEGPDEPVGPPPEVDDPAEGEHLSSPEPGHPVGVTEPEGGVEPGTHEHPEDIGTSTDEESEQTESPGTPADPDAG